MLSGAGGGPLYKAQEFSKALKTFSNHEKDGRNYLKLNAGLGTQL